MAKLSKELAKIEGYQGLFSEGGFYGPEVTDASRKPYSIPFIYSHISRANGNLGSWSSGDGWTTFYTYGGAGEPDAERGFWYNTGGHREDTYSYANYYTHPTLQWVKFDEATHDFTRIYPTSRSDYTDVMFKMIFLRNYDPSNQRSVTMYAGGTSAWSSGYDGGSFWVGTPNATTYSATTRINWSNQYSYTSATSNWNNSYTVTIPAGRTVAVMLMTSGQLVGGTTNLYTYRIGSYFYSLHTAFNSSFWIQPDYRLTHAALTYSDIGNFEYTSYTAHRVWNRAAELFGDR